jgi:hypothetical protein
MNRDGATIAVRSGMRRLASTLLFVSATIVAAGAHAQRPRASDTSTTTTPTSPWLARPLSVETQLGDSAPLGTAGATIGYSPVPWATIGAGVGLEQRHVQLAVIPRVHQLLSETLALSVGAGISAGASSDAGRDDLRHTLCMSCSEAHERTFALAWWGNAELSLEDREPWGLAWRFFVGGARVLNPGDGTCPSGAGTCDDHRVVVYTGIGVGWTFSI